MGEDRGDLERAGEPHARDRRRRAAGDVAALEVDLARRRRQEMGQQVEARRLARTVRPDQGMNGVAPYAEIDVFDRDEAPELLRQPFRLENYFFFGHSASPRRFRINRRSTLLSSTGAAPTPSVDSPHVAGRRNRLGRIGVCALVNRFFMSARPLPPPALSPWAWRRSPRL